MKTRGVRGATQVPGNSALDIKNGVVELLNNMISENAIQIDDLISIIFTATVDLDADFPAVAAREIGLGQVPLLCGVEIDVPGALPRVIRVLMHINSNKDLSQIKHIYLRGATSLRKDLAQ